MSRIFSPSRRSSFRALLGRVDDLDTLVGVVRRSAVFCNLIPDSVATVDLEPRTATTADACITTCKQGSDIVSLQWVAHILNGFHGLICRTVAG